jgi:hypothetical protein
VPHAHKNHCTFVRQCVRAGMSKGLASSRAEGKEKGPPPVSSLRLADDGFFFLR